jgi:predicted Zn-dependent protease
LDNPASFREKRPGAAVSEAVEPIVYYVDNGAPKAIQNALIEGAAWWNQAYEAAGFRNAFQVKVLPADADPMDVRYNVINWVHRSTRGWAYGSSITDPRTGEIIKGVVTLDSQRARQDFLIGSGLVPQYAANGLLNGACDFALLPDVDYLINTAQKNDAECMSLARIRQLSAHEVGHTLGLAHNFAASTYGRASVMDYPAPMIEIKDGNSIFQTLMPLVSAHMTNLRFVMATRNFLPAQTKTMNSKKFCARASQTECFLSRTMTLDRQAQQIRSLISGITEATRWQAETRNAGAANRLKSIWIE